MDKERNEYILRTLADILCSTSVASIEILPGGLEDWISVDSIQEDRRPTPESPFLLFDGNLGIPKKVLYKLYLAAVVLFQSSKSAPELCRVTTCTILLANPAHQTALNARKRLVQNGDLPPEQELSFIEVLFRGSSLCAKESILWHHRRWLFNHIHQGRLQLCMRDRPMKWTTSSDICPLPNIPPDTIVREFSVVRRACESYPRNYHAWTHWYFLVDIINTVLFVDEISPDPYVDILIDELNALKDWVEHHVSDHSCVFRLCCLNRLLDDLENHPSSSRRETFITYRSLIDHAFSLLTSYPSHESLWIYLRDSAVLLPASEKHRLIEKVQSSPLVDSPFSKRFVVDLFR